MSWNVRGLRAPQQFHWAWDQHVSCHPHPTPGPPLAPGVALGTLPFGFPAMLTYTVGVDDRLPGLESGDLRAEKGAVMSDAHGTRAHCVPRAAHTQCEGLR